MKSILKIFTSFQMFMVLLLGFSSGLPLGLTSGTMQAWLKTENVDIGTIGLFSLVGLPYSLKIFWSPLLDRYLPPFLGMRRGWLLITQIFLILALIIMGIIGLTAGPQIFAFLAFLVAFFSSSQDIVIDAYRTEALTEEEWGAGAGIYIMGYRIAMIVSGAGALIMADHFSWRMVYITMAICMVLGVLASIFGPDPLTKEVAPKDLKEAYLLPLIEYFKRSGSVEMLIFILIYKIDVAFAMAFTTPFMMDLGFSKTDIGTVLKGAGMVATIIGTLIGGGFLARFGIKKSLWAFGIIQGVSGFTFYLLAHMGHNYPFMVLAICTENLCSGLATSAFTAFMMRIVDKRFTATQFALLTSFMALTRILVSTPSGYIAKSVGWEWYFIISILLSIPGLLLLLRYDRWQLDHQ